MKKQISLYLMVLSILSTLCIAVTADVLPPALEIKGVTFSEVLYAGQTQILSINIKNTGLGNAHDLTVELSSNLQGLSFPTSTKVPTIPKGSTQTVEISISGKKNLSNEDEAWISIRLIDKGHNQEFPFDKPRIRKFKTRELELVLDQVKFKNVARPNKSIQRNDVINLKFRVWNKSGVTAEKVKVKLENNQNGVIWLGVKIDEPLEAIEDLLKEHPTFAAIKSNEHKVVNYIYHLNRDFKDPKVQFTFSGTVGAEKDHWVKEEYKNPVIIPSNWFRIFGWAVGTVIIVIIIGVTIKKNGKFVPRWVSNFRFSIRIPSNWPHIFGWVVGAIIIAIRWVSNFWFSSGHTERVTSVEYSPNGTTLASGAYDNTVKLWDVKTQRNIATFEGHTAWVNAVAYSPDGTTLASGACDNTVKLWDVKTQRNIATFEEYTELVSSSIFRRKVFSGQRGLVSSVVYSPDGTTLASGVGDTVKLRDVKTQRNIATFEGHTGLVSSVEYSPNGTTLASGAYDNTVKLWNVKTQRNIATFEGHTGLDSSSIFRRKVFSGQRGLVSSVVYSPDGTTLASGVGDTVKLRDVKTQRNIATFEGHTGLVSSVAYSPDGTTLASGAHDNTVKLWNVKTQRNIATFEGHTGLVSSVAYSPDGTTLASGAYDNTVKLWNVKTQRNIATFEGHTGLVSSVVYSPDGTTLASGAHGNMVKLRDVKTQRNIATY